MLHCAVLPWEKAWNLPFHGAGGPRPRLQWVKSRRCDGGPKAGCTRACRLAEAEEAACLCLCLCGLGRL